MRRGPKVEYDVVDLARFSENTKTPIDLEAAKLYRIPSSMLAKFYNSSSDALAETGDWSASSKAMAEMKLIHDEIRSVCSGKYHCVPPMLQRSLAGLARDGDSVLVDALVSILYEGYRKRR